MRQLNALVSYEVWAILKTKSIVLEISSKDVRVGVKGEARGMRERRRGSGTHTIRGYCKGCNDTVVIAQTRGCHSSNTFAARPDTRRSSMARIASARNCTRVDLICIMTLFSLVY